MEWQLTSAELALAFNQQNTRKTWTARVHSKPESGQDVVHFNTTIGNIGLTYNLSDGRWRVVFNKTQAAWGDYVKSIARSLYVVLNTLKSAGLPFDAPTSPDGVEILVTSGEGATTYVRWVPPEIQSQYSELPPLSDRTLDALNYIAHGAGLTPEQALKRDAAYNELGRDPAP